MLEKLGKYTLLDRIGAGGLGDVYRARDTQHGRTVAIKVVPDAIARDPEKRARLAADANAASALSHPNIAALYELGEDRDHLYLAFEFVPGETLKAAIAGRPMNPRHAAEHGVQIADALADGHGAGIIHRDIRPDTIMITPKGSAKILDFGLSSWTWGGTERDAIAARGYASGAAASIAAYMSPEQLQGLPVDHRTDIFSFGLVLFEMLTGRRPFGATATSRDVLVKPAPAPSTLKRDLRTDFDAVVARALAKKPEERYEAAATLAAELRSIAAVLDVRSGEIEPVNAIRVRTQPRRNRTPLLIGLGALA